MLPANHIPKKGDVLFWANGCQIVIPLEDLKENGKVKCFAFWSKCRPFSAKPSSIIKISLNELQKFSNLGPQND